MLNYWFQFVRQGHLFIGLLFVSEISYPRKIFYPIGYKNSKSPDIKIYILDF